MRAVSISARRAGKSRTALLGTHTAPCDAILDGFRRFQTSKLFTARKANAKNILDIFSMHIVVTYFVQTSSSECS